MDANILYATLIFSIIGMVFFSYGRKDNLYFMLSGIALMAYPYAVATFSGLIIVGLILLILPFLLSKFFPL